MNFKRIVSMILTVVMTLLLSACAGNNYRDIRTLIKYDIIEESDYDKSEYITNREMFEAIGNVFGEGRQTLSEWYNRDELEPYDHLDDSLKELIMEVACGQFKVLNAEELENINFDENATNFEVLTYLVRMIGNTSGCTNYPKELDITEKEEIYNIAYQKGLISKVDTENSDKPILRKEFYKLLNKTINTEFQSGGSAGVVSFKYVDMLKERASAESKKKVNSTEIPVEITMNDDMSISWKMPHTYEKRITEDYTVWMDVYTDKGEKRGGRGYSDPEHSLDAEGLIDCVLSAYPEKAAYIRYTYYDISFSSDREVKTEYYFDIDVSDITVKVEGEELSPGVYTRFPGQWVAASLSLADGQKFKSDAYYLLKGKDMSDRRKGHFIMGNMFFKSNSDTDTILNLDKKRPNLGVTGLDEVTIQEATVSGDWNSGITIHITPESSKGFTIEELSE